MTRNELKIIPLQLKERIILFSNCFLDVTYCGVTQRPNELSLIVCIEITTPKLHINTDYVFFDTTLDFGRKDYRKNRRIYYKQLRTDFVDKSWEDVLPKARESVYSEVKKLQEFLLERLEVENDRRAN